MSALEAINAANPGEIIQVAPVTCYENVVVNKKHFELSIKHVGQIKEKYGNILEKLITKSVGVKDYRQAFIRCKEDIKTIICFEHQKS